MRSRNLAKQHMHRKAIAASITMHLGSIGNILYLLVGNTKAKCLVWESRKSHLQMDVETIKRATIKPHQFGDLSHVPKR